MSATGARNKVLVVIAGPTAVGKTGVAIQIAKKLHCEIVSADSRQIYREMSIGTAKPSKEELASVKHHFIDSHSIAEDYDAAQFGDEALTVIEKLFEKDDFVILCGGSGLYIKAVCDGFDEIPEVPESIRESLIEGYEKNGVSWLQEKMQELDLEHFAIIDQQNPHRLIRALEVRIATGKSIATFRKNNKRKHSFNILKIGLELSREELYQRIDSRMDVMINEGLFDEAKNLYPYKMKNALQTVGYQEIFDFMDGHYDFDEAVRLLKRNSRRYAKRQLTWFKKDEDFYWFHPQQLEAMLKLIEEHTFAA